MFVHESVNLSLPAEPTADSSKNKGQISLKSARLWYIQHLSFYAQITINTLVLHPSTPQALLNLFCFKRLTLFPAQLNQNL